MYNINSSKIIKGSLAFVIASGVVFSPVGIDNDSEAAEANSSMVSKKSVGTISKINDNVARIDLNKGITYNVDENGVATIKDTHSGKTEQLPVTAKDKNGEDATLVYFEEDGKLGVQVVKQQQERGAAKCIIGTVGGAIGGGIGGASGGYVAGC